MEWAEMQKGEGPEQDNDAMQQREQQRNQQLTQAAAQLGKQPQELPPLPQQQPILKSSIPVDDSEDHVNEAMECSRILNSPEGQKIKRTQDMGDGRKGADIWLDLKLHMNAHVAAGKAKNFMFPPPIEGPPPPPMPMPKPGMGGPGGPGAPPAGAAPLPPLATPAPGGLPNATA